MVVLSVGEVFQGRLVNQRWAMLCSAFTSAQWWPGGVGMVAIGVWGPSMTGPGGRWSWMIR